MTRGGLAGGGAPVRCEGVLARLCPGYAAWRVGGRAGRQSGDDEADIMLFAAGWGSRSADLLGRFLADEMGEMDWLADYLRNEQLEQLVVTLKTPVDEEAEEEEIIYDRRGLSPTADEYIYEP